MSKNRHLAIYPYQPFWYIIASEIGSLTPHGISAFNAVHCDNSQTKLKAVKMKKFSVTNLLIFAFEAVELV